MAITQQHSAERIAGRAYGVMFFAGFGSLWMLLGLAAMHRLNWLTGTLILAVLLTLVLPALCLRRQANARRGAGSATEDDVARERRVRRAFNRINAAQYVAIPFVILCMNLLRRPEWIAPGIAVVVGLHLLPLAQLFRTRANYITGAALIAYAVFTMAALPRAAVPSLAQLGTAAILLVSVACSLLGSRAALTAQAQSQPA